MYWAYYMMIGRSKGSANGPKRFWFEDETEWLREPIDRNIFDATVKRLHETKVNMALVQVDDGVLYESHPEINAPGAMTKQELKEKLDVMRSLGITPIPLLTFSTVHHYWLKEYRYMVSSQIYRKVCVDLIDEICELFDHPKLFHLGMDEESSFDCQQWRECVVMRGEKLFWEDFNIFFDACRRNGARPWVYGDYYWIHPDYFERNMSKDVLLSNWFYGRFKDYPQGDFHHASISAYEDFERLGFDQVPTCSALSCKQNAWETMYHCKKVITPERLKGFCMAPWVSLTKEDELLIEHGIRQYASARAKEFPNE